MASRAVAPNSYRLSGLASRRLVTRALARISRRHQGSGIVIAIGNLIFGLLCARQSSLSRGSWRTAAPRPGHHRHSVSRLRWTPPSSPMSTVTRPPSFAERAAPSLPAHLRERSSLRRLTFADGLPVTLRFADASAKYSLLRRRLTGLHFL
jgi:hypothetical protein